MHLRVKLIFTSCFVLSSTLLCHQSDSYKVSVMSTPESALEHPEHTLAYKQGWHGLQLCHSHPSIVTFTLTQFLIMHTWVQSHAGMHTLILFMDFHGIDSLWNIILNLFARHPEPLFTFLVSVPVLNSWFSDFVFPYSLMTLWLFSVTFFASPLNMSVFFSNTVQCSPAICLCCQ